MPAYTIGYAAGAMVWHHRRATVAAYAKQQKGYGRSEAMVHFKHPQRFGPYGRSSWRGIIYGDGAVGLPLKRDLVYHGRFGSGLFQTIYRHNDYGVWSCLMSLEWHLLAIFMLLLATLFWPLAGVSVLMWLATLMLGLRMGSRAPLPKDAPWWCRPLVTYLYILQPILRGWYRMTHCLRQMKLPRDTRRRFSRQRADQVDFREKARLVLAKRPESWSRRNARRSSWSGPASRVFAATLTTPGPIGTSS